MTPHKLRLPPTPAWGDIGGWDQPQYYATIQLADIDGDGQAELLGRWAGGIQVNHFDTATESWVARRPGPPLSDSAHWDQPQYYTTIQFADIDGDGQAELVARGPDGIQSWHYNPRRDTWTELQAGGPFADSAQNGTAGTRWEEPQYYTTIRLADIDGQLGAELIGRGADGLHMYRFNARTHTWSAAAAIPELNDADGWDQPEHYSTIQLADVDGLPGAELAARGTDGLHIYRYEAKTGSWGLLSIIPQLKDAEYRNRAEFDSSIQLADIDGKAGAEVIAREAEGLHVYRYERESRQWTPLASIQRLSDANGWSRPEYGNTIQLADVDGQPGAEVIARGSEGVEVWHYNPKGNRWSSRRRASISSMSDASGWNVPQQYLTIQAANIDGRSGAEIIGRSATGIETWRFVGANSAAIDVAGTGDFPPYTGGPQQTYYKFISNQLGYGTDIRATYDSLSDNNLTTALNKLSALNAPDNVSPTDWQSVKNQITTELTYVETANDWILGPRGSQSVTTQIFLSSSLDVAAVASTLTNVDDSSSVAMGLVALLAKIVQGISALGGNPAASGVASILATVFSELQGGGLAPNLTIQVGKIDGQIATMYNGTLNAANLTHDAMVTNWSQLQAFAQSRVGHAPSDDEVIQIRWAGEVQYAEWIWRTITPAVWTRVAPEFDGNSGCAPAPPDSYQDPAPLYYLPSVFCDAWIGTIGSGGNAPPPSVVMQAWGTCPQGQPFCPDPVHGPFGFSAVDPFTNQGGWDLPCTGSNCSALPPALTAERKQEIAEARDAFRSLATLVGTSTSTQGEEDNLADPLEAAALLLKSQVSSTRLEFAACVLQNFVLQIRTVAPWRLDPATRRYLIATANAIRGRLTGPAPVEVLLTRHSRSQSM
jgi:hypothetical protein